ncbi:unnamed protein product, partial [Timema podura]|nr:unnamed protein product [Timema podura]
IFQQANKKKAIPQLEMQQRIKRFYNCVASLMTYQLQCLCISSIEDYTHFICNVGYTNPGFIVNIVQRNKIIMFEPSFNSFRDVLLGVYDTMITAVNGLPRLETKLYMEFDTGDVLKSLHVLIPVNEETLMDQKPHNPSSAPHLLPSGPDHAS